MEKRFVKFNNTVINCDSEDAAQLYAEMYAERLVRDNAGFYAGFYDWNGDVLEVYIDANTEYTLTLSATQC